MIVLVTGASAGFGREMACRFVREGHQVIATARRAEKLAALREELGANLLPLTMDVTDTASIAQALTQLPENWRAIDVLINNAGLAIGTEAAQESSLDEWQRMIDTNVRGLVAMTHAVLPGMVARDSGMIINIGSIAGTNAYPGGNVYGATKAFVDQFTKNLRADLVGTGVRATVIAPGFSKGTEFWEVRLRGNTESVQNIHKGTVPLSTADIAEAAYWVATLPPHVNINFLEMMPTCQACGPLMIKRKG